MKIYIASKFDNRERVKEINSILHDRAISTVQTWPYEHASCTRQQAALRDLAEVDSADGVLLFTEDCQRVPGGMHFEAGYALGRGKRVWIVGPLVHVFCELPESKLVFHYETVEQFADSVQEPARYLCCCGDPSCSGMCETL